MKTDQDFIDDKDNAIRYARKIMANPYCIIDTETTGLHQAQMCQIAALYSDGRKFKSLVKPTIPITLGASSVHHITDEMVEDAPNAVDVINQIIDINIPIIIYNAEFDTKIILQSLDALDNSQIIFPEIHDAMKIYADFRGEWNDYYGNYRWHKLGIACGQCGIVIDVDLHDALSDVIMTERLMKYVAAQPLSTEN